MRSGGGTSEGKVKGRVGVERRHEWAIGDAIGQDEMGGDGRSRERIR